MAVAPVADLIARELAQTDFHARLPMHRRVYESLRQAILQHRLDAGDRLPSSRDLAAELGISRNTVMSAFNQLIAEGYVDASVGSGTYVSDTFARPLAQHARATRATAPSPARIPAPLPPAPAELSRRGAALIAHGGAEHFEVQPFAGEDAEDWGSFPVKIWQRLQNKHWRAADTSLLDYDTQGGAMRLRRAIANYLRISRSVNVTPEQVLITAGTQQSIDLAARMLADAGETAWIENPCYWAAERVLRANGLSLRAIAVDDEGVSPNAEDLATHPRLIYVTPSHQYPSGVIMSLARRRQLLDFAARTGAWILEDDYDAEFRYEGRPIASLQGLDGNGRVLYMGTFSKVLYPGMRIGYIVVPPALLDALRVGLYDLQRPGQLMVQAALADFIEMGYFASHIRRQRQVYGQRREALVRALQSVLGQALSLSPIQTGLHLVIHLPAEIDDAALAETCAREGIGVLPLSRYYIAMPVARGLVVGYAYVREDVIETRGRVLGRLVKKALAQRG